MDTVEKVKKEKKYYYYEEYKCSIQLPQGSLYCKAKTLQ